MSQYLFGQSVEQCASASDPDVVGAAIDVGGSVLRPPIAIMPAVQKIVGGAVASLTDHERSMIQLAGVQLERIAVTDNDRNVMRTRLQAEGKSQMEAYATAMGMKDGYRSVKPVAISTYFRKCKS